MSLAEREVIRAGRLAHEEPPEGPPKSAFWLWFIAALALVCVVGWIYWHS